MSLYYEAEKFLAGTSGGSEKEGQAGGSLKARIFNAKNLKSTPSQVYALVTEASKWSSVLKEVIERAGILKFERKVRTCTYTPSTSTSQCSKTLYKKVTNWFEVLY